MQNYLHFFLPKSTSHSCCCFPQTYLFLEENRWSFPRTSTVTHYCGTVSIIPFYFSSEASTAAAGSQQPRRRLQHNSDKRPQGPISRGLSTVTILKAHCPYPVYKDIQTRVYTGPLWSKIPNTCSPSSCCLM